MAQRWLEDNFLLRNSQFVCKKTFTEDRKCFLEMKQAHFNKAQENAAVGLAEIAAEKECIKGSFLGQISKDFSQPVFKRAGIGVYAGMCQNGIIFLIER